MTTTTAQPPRLPGQKSAPRDWGQTVRKTGPKLPSRLVIHGVEGVGKTSVGASAPSPIFLMARGETGLETLIDANRIGETPHFPEIQVWDEFMQAVDWLATNEHSYRTLVIDTLNGLERLCHEHVCARDFKGDWSEKGFMGYMRGYEISLGDWRMMLNALDSLRERKRMAVIALCHTKVTTFKNPEGADYDRYQPAMHAKTWELTHRWADHVLFANYYAVVENVVESKSSKRGKATGGQERVLYTVRHAAYDAKNRAGLPEEISMGNSGAEAWSNIMTALMAGKAGA